MPRWTCYICTLYHFIFSGVHWVIVAYAQMDFVLQYLKLIQFLVMAHYYWTLATRALRRERLTKWYVPVLYKVFRSHRRLKFLFAVYLHAALRSKSKYFVGVESEKCVNVEWHLTVNWCMDCCVSMLALKEHQLSVLIKYKVHIISSKCNLISTWYGWKIAHYCVKHQSFIHSETVFMRKISS